MDPITLALVTAAISQGVGYGAKKLFGDEGQGQYGNVSRLSPEQKRIQRQLNQAIQGPGAGGAYGTAADYYRSLFDPNSETFQGLAAPEQRNFQENIIPGLSEQFAGMGAGALSSSGFRNAAIGAGTDLSERLGAIRAGLRQQGAQGLMNLGNQGLQDYNIPTYQNQDPGFGGSFANLAGQVIPGAINSFTGGGNNAQQATPANAVPASPPTGNVPYQFDWNMKQQAGMPTISSKGQSSPYGNQSRSPFPNLKL